MTVYTENAVSQSQESWAPFSDAADQEHDEKRNSGRGGQGGGMSDQNSEPEEELQAILDEVQGKYQLDIYWLGYRHWDTVSAFRSYHII